MQDYVGLLIAIARRRIKQVVLSRVVRHRLSSGQFWILIGLAIFRVAWRFAIRRYSAVGG